MILAGTPMLLVDLDGTVREPLSGEGFITEPSDQRIIEGAEAALNYYSRGGWLIVGITNQGGVASGFKSLEDAITEQKYTLALCPQLRSIYFCPDFEGSRCYYVGRDRTVAVHEEWKKYADLIGTYRKPNAGMVKLATMHELWETLPHPGMRSAL